MNIRDLPRSLCKNHALASCRNANLKDYNNHLLFHHLHECVDMLCIYFPALLTKQWLVMEEVFMLGKFDSQDIITG